MTVFLYEDGLVRLASQKYDANKNYADSYIHLTNYSLNKNNKEYDGDQHKLKLSDVLTGILSQPPVKKGKPGVTRSANEIWSEIEEIVVKTIITV
jgi:tubulin polyglutamylase TTLL6/13